MVSGQGKISARQLMILTTLYTVGSAILIIPSGMAFVAKQDAWIAALAGVGGGPLILYLYIKITSLYPQMTLIEIMESLLGKWLGKAVGLLFFTTIFIISSIYPSYELAKKINIGNFLQRIEAIMAAMWQLVLPLGIVLVVMSIIVYPNFPYKQAYDTKTWIPYTLSIGFLFPLLLLGIHALKRLWTKNNGRQ